MNKSFNYSANKIKFLLLPVIIIVVGIIMYFVRGGFNFDVEFVGGTRMQVAIDGKVDNKELAKVIKDATGLDATIQQSATDNNVIIKLPAADPAPEKAAKPEAAADTETTEAATDRETTETAETAAEAATAEAVAGETETAATEEAADAETAEAVADAAAAAEAEAETEEVTDAGNIVAQEVLQALRDNNYKFNENSVEISSTDASFGKEVQTKALTFTLLAILCILIYIIIRFEWRSGVMAVIALALNVLVMAAVYTITNIPLNTTFIAAMLTVVGYSINNTIVIFDRIRENMKQRKRTEAISDMTNRSITETLGRTINSTITTLITIVLIYILGVTTIKEFALPLIIGIVVGAYTSIFIASTFWAAWKESEAEAKAAAAAERRSAKKGNKK